MIEDLLVYYADGEAVFAPAVAAYRRAHTAGEVSPWAEVLARHGSDKGAWHSYPLFYQHLFPLLPQPPRAIFEVGLGTNNTDVPGHMGPDGVPGASHRAWRELFPEAQIYGADLDPRVLFDEPNLRTFFMDQYDVDSIHRAWTLMPHLRFDIVIDDGAHTFEANTTLLDATYARVTPGGLYVVEDIVATLPNLSRFDDYLTRRGWDACLIRLPHAENRTDNALALIRPHPPG